MSATKTEALRIERWARAQERHMILVAVEREAATWADGSAAYVRRLHEVIVALPVLVLPKARRK